MMLDYGKGYCDDLEIAGRLEWLMTNGIGGYAMGTVAGVLTRCYHGLLVAAMSPPGELAGLPPAARTLLLVKLDETATYGGHSYPIHANRYRRPAAKGEVVLTTQPRGFTYLERFHLDGTTPVWTFALADALLERRIWMQPGANTTYVHYTLVRGSAPLRLDLCALINYRDHHGNVPAEETWPIRVEPVNAGLRFVAFEDSPPFYLLSQGTKTRPRQAWQDGFYLAVEDYRGLPDKESHFHAGELQATLQPGDSATVVASTDSAPNLDGTMAWQQRHAYEQRLLEAMPAGLSGDDELSARALRHLVLAADQFVVDRQLSDGSTGRSVIAGYPWFGDWGRDTMISLPGLTLATGRPEVARRVLQTFAHFVDRGMLPNRFPDAGQKPEYNTVDATLWYIEAIRAYHAATGDDDLLRELYPVLQDVVAWHQRGTRYHIHMDPMDGLLYAGQPGVQLTWMDAKVEDWVVTPRIGKPVEINAMWYNGLRVMARFAALLDQQADEAAYDRLAVQARDGFARFWNGDLGYCYDVLDGPHGHDPSLRPNQLFAVSLSYSPLGHDRQRAVVDVCARHLLTSHGLRSLALGHPDYIGRYGGDRRTRDAAYHQGTVWGWLIGPFVSAHLRTYQDPAQARAFLRPLLQHLEAHCVGSLSEIFDGDPPHTPRGCIAQAWTVAEVLRAWRETGVGGQKAEVRS